MPRLEALPNTPEWIAARRGLLTASRMRDVMNVLKNGKPGADRERYLMELVAERMTGTAMPHFVTPAMQWGTDHEQEAVQAYADESGNSAIVSGFYLHDTIEYFGATPDREIDEDGLLECKCPTTTTFIRWLRDGVVPEEHKPQMLAQLAVTKRRFCDFIAYDPRVQKGPKFLIRRFEPTADEIADIEEAAVQFLREIELVFDAVTTGKAA